MKKLALILLLLFPFILTGCVSTKDLESRGKQTVVIENDCEWAMKLNIRLNDFSGYQICSLDLEREPVTIELYNDTDYVFEINGVYDSITNKKAIKYKSQTYILIDWDIYKGDYRIRYR